MNLLLIRGRRFLKLKFEFVIFNFLDKLVGKNFNGKIWMLVI